MRDSSIQGTWVRRAAALALGLATASSFALPIRYEGTLLSGAAVAGSVGGNGWESETAADADFWRFDARAGDLLTLVGTRLSTGLDPVFTLYFGTTSADASRFLHDADWGGLNYLALADDEIAVGAGPGGDPALRGFVAPYTGSYTVAFGGIGSDGTGPFNYRLELGTVAAVPEPASSLLMAAGLGVLGLLLRRRTLPRPTGAAMPA